MGELASRSRYPGYGLFHGISRSSEAALKEAQTHQNSFVDSEEVTLTAFRFILDELKVASRASATLKMSSRKT